MKCDIFRVFSSHSAIQGSLMTALHRTLFRTTSEAKVLQAKDRSSNDLGRSEMLKMNISADPGWQQGGARQGKRFVTLHQRQQHFVSSMYIYI